MDQSAHDSSETSSKNLLKNFLYSGCKTTDELALRQVFFINTFAILGFLSVTTFGILHFLDKNYYIALPEITGGAVFILSIIYLRISKNINIAKTLLLLTQGTLLIVMLATGGTANTGIFWYFTFPVTAFFLTGIRRGMIWIIALYITTLFVFILGNLGFVAIVYTFIEVRQLLAVLFVISTLIYLYQSSLDKSETGLRLQANQLQISKRAIEQAKAEDEAILSSLGEGMITMGTSGNIFLINKIALTILGLEEQNTVGQSINNIVSIKNNKEEIVGLEDRPWYLVTNNNKSVNGEYIFVNKDKALEFPVWLTAAPIVLNNTTIGVILLFKDITEEKRLDTTKSEFVALASHQLRTPISAISWFAEMLLHGDAGAINEEQKDHLTQIYQSNHRMAALVDALLNVSRLEMGNFSITPVPVVLASFCHKVLTDEMGKIEPPKKFKIKENYDPLVKEISIDPDLMKIIMQNIFTNAIKYTPEGGAIAISISYSSQSVQQNSNNKIEGILITVSDTGYGIPSSQANKIFTKLFRADNIKAKDTDGTGLGLYIVRSILDYVGGRIWFESPARNANVSAAGEGENKGTTFYVFLPKEGMKAKGGEKKLTPAKNHE